MGGAKTGRMGGNMAEQEGRGRKPGLPPCSVCGLRLPSPSSLAGMATPIPGSWMMSCVVCQWLMVRSCDPQAYLLLVYFHFFQAPWPLLFHTLCQLCFLLRLHFCCCIGPYWPSNSAFPPQPPTALLSSYLSAPFFSGVLAVSFFFLSAFLFFFFFFSNSI